MAIETAPAAPAADPVVGLRLSVRDILSERAGALRRALPSRPDTPAGRYAWWRALSPAQQRQAALLDRLDALCGHLAGRPALGYADDDPIPDAALEAADGFTSERAARQIAKYRAAHRQEQRAT
ncbi:hypothetical protein ACWDZ4_20190 [Streptomyces sp. NPDC003016]